MDENRERRPTPNSKKAYRMSTAFEFQETIKLMNAMYAFTEAMDANLAFLGHADLLPPDHEDYRIVMGHHRMMIEVDLLVTTDAHMTVRVPFSVDANELTVFAREACAQLGQRLSKLDELLALRDSIGRYVRQRMQGLARSGPRGRVVELRLGPIDLVQRVHPKAGIEVVVEGEACHMLRPFRDRWQVETLEAAEEEFDQFRSRQRQRIWSRRRAMDLGAIGYIDPLALRLIDLSPSGRQEILREIATKLEGSWLFDGEGHDRVSMGLVWYDGIVRGVGTPCDGVTLSGESTIIRGSAIDLTSAGRLVRDFVPDQIFEGITITAVNYAREGFADVRLSIDPLPFTLNGEVLMRR